MTMYTIWEFVDGPDSDAVNPREGLTFTQAVNAGAEIRAAGRSVGIDRDDGEMATNEELLLICGVVL